HRSPPAPTRWWPTARRKSIPPFLRVPPVASSLSSPHSVRLSLLGVSPRRFLARLLSALNKRRSLAFARLRPSHLGPGIQVRAPRLKLQPESKLPFAPRQVLQNRPDRWTCAFEPLHRRGIASIEQVEEFEEHLPLYALSEVEPLRHSHVHVHE